MPIKKTKNKTTIQLGGKDGERLYLRDLKFKLSDGRRVNVKRTNVPGTNMPDLIARAKGRYALVALYSRPGQRVLDFPSGGGYSAEFLKEFGVIYEGREQHLLTVEYAKLVYRGKSISFKMDDLSAPKLRANYYDTIGCIEGLEHIDHQYQVPLIAALYRALKPGGTLIISSPENATGTSGRSQTNPYHLWELSRKDFVALLETKFKSKDVQLLIYQAVLSYAKQLTTCFFAVCRK